MIYIYECPAERLEEVRDWMTAKDTEVFGNLTRKEAKNADGHAGVMEITIDDGDITCECKGIYSGPEREIQYEMENYFTCLKEQFPFLEVDGEFAYGFGETDWHNWGIYSSSDDTRARLCDLDYVEPEYCRICGCEIKSMPFWADWTGTVCVCSPECACEATLGYLLAGNDWSVTTADGSLRIIFDGGFQSIMPDVLIPVLPEYADRVLTKDNVLPFLKALDSRRTKEKIASDDLEEEDILAAKAVLLEYANKLGVKDTPEFLPTGL